MPGTEDRLWIDGHIFTGRELVEAMLVEGGRVTAVGSRAEVLRQRPTGVEMERLDGRLIMGATVEEKGFDTTLTAGGLLTLLEAAWRAIPAVEELPIDEMWVGHRPGSRDDAPILGPAPLDGLIYATGHHRNGILLAPVTADAIARLVLDGTLDPAIRPFGMERFTPAKAAE